MKQSWIVGIVMLYIILQGLTMVMQADTIGATSIWGVMDSLWRLNYTNTFGASAVTAALVPGAVMISVMLSFGQILILYYPVIFQGTYVWFYWCVCLPIAIGFIISLITILRGVGSN